MFIKRKILSILEKHLDGPEALVITGFRRVGKSTLIKHIYDNLKTSNKIFLDMESPVNQDIFQEKNYDAIVTKLKSIGLRIGSDRGYVFLDEIQFVKDIASVIKYLLDHYQIKFVLTGSSSFYLKNHFTESLSGRKFIFELYPLTFEEFLWFKGTKITLDAGYSDLRHFYDEYMAYGGFPAVVLAEGVENKNLKLDDALGSYFQLDVVNLASFHDIKMLKSLIFLLSSRAGSKLDITKLAEILEVSRQTIYNYLEFLNDTYLIHLVSAYSQSGDVITRKVQKLYFNDSGLLNRVAKVSEGQLFENTVFNQLNTSCYLKNTSQLFLPKVYYFQKKNGIEIDFITENKAYETKLAGSKSDVLRLRKLADKLGIKEYSIISLEQNDNEKIIQPFKL